MLEQTKHLLTMVKNNIGWPALAHAPGLCQPRQAANGKSPCKSFIIQGFEDFCGAPSMPIYAYRCEECGFTKDVLQKISDPVLTVCPSCAKPSFKKQVTAAGFQLKGTGWYVTDFRGGTPPATGTASNGNGNGAPAPAASTESSAPAAATPAPAAPGTSGGDKSST